MQGVLVALLVIHAAVHVVRGVRRCRLRSVPRVDTRTLVRFSPGAGTMFGVLWLASCSLLLVAAGLLLLRSEAWWQYALAGSALSQTLVVIAWPVEKFGTIANVLIAGAVLVAAAHARFVRVVDRDAKALLDRSPDRTGSPVMEAELDRLPPPIRRWVAGAGVVGHERAHTVRLRQRGEMRPGVEQPWMPVQAEQYFSVDDPGFVWKVEARMLHVIPVSGRDRLVGGEGHMLIKAASLVDLANAGDDKIALGAMLRFLGEIVWFPSAALSPYIEWESVDEARARATMRDGTRVVTATFVVDERGRVTQIMAHRYLGGGPEAKLTPWFVQCTAWRVIRGIEIPVRGDAIWRLATADFDYYRWEILDVETNLPDLYSRRGDDAVREASQSTSLVTPLEYAPPRAQGYS